MNGSNGRFFGRGLPYVNIDDLTGRLIVIEGSDGVGRTTQIGLLKTWLEVQGFGVVETGWARSPLVGETIDLAKSGHDMNVLTFNLLYATDFADRLEHEIIPALRSGFIVLADRYIYTVFARAAARQADPQWIRDLFGFAIQPDLVLYLKVDVDTLIQRVLLSANLDYWEAGLDQYPGYDPYDSFVHYQARLLRQFNTLAREFHFQVIDARKSVEEVQLRLRKRIAKLLNIPVVARV